jgi:hypothetical protein
MNFRIFLGEEKEKRLIWRDFCRDKIERIQETSMIAEMVWGKMKMKKMKIIEIKIIIMINKKEKRFTQK